MDDAHFGWTHRPGWYGWRTDENRVWITINDQGLFDHDHSFDKPAATRRIAVLGDSFLSAFNVPLSLSVVTLLEAEVNRCTSAHGQRAEAINFGVLGYGTAQELLTYRAKVRPYHPDVVVLVAYLGNDIVNNHPRLNPMGEAPYFKLVDGELVFVPMPAREPVDLRTETFDSQLPWYQRARLAITRRSKAARLAYELWGVVKNGGRLPYVHGESRPDAVFRAPLEQDLSDAWSVTEALVKTLAAEVTADGADFLLVTAPIAEQADGRPEVRQAAAARYGVESVDYADRRLNEFAAANGIKTLSLLAPLTEYAERHRQSLYGGYLSDVPAGTGHWNEWGNRVVANVIGQRLCAGD